MAADTLQIKTEYFEDYMLRTIVHPEQLTAFVGQLSEGKSAELPMEPVAAGVFAVKVLSDGLQRPFRVFDLDRAMQDSDWTPADSSLEVTYEAKSIRDIHFSAADITGRSTRLILGHGVVRIDGSMSLPNRIPPLWSEESSGTAIALQADIQSHTLALLRKGQQGEGSYTTDITLARLERDNPNEAQEPLMWQHSA